MVDLLQPISSANRMERMLVEYDGFLNSLTERFIMGLELHKENYLHHEKFKEILELSNDDIFNISNLYTIKDFNELYLNDELDDAYIKELLSIDLLNFQRRPIINYSLYNLIQENFVESISIIKKEEFLENELELLSNTFGEYFSKVKLYTGTTESLANDFEFTTICTSSFNTIRNIINSKKDKKIYFILQNKYDNIDIETMEYKFMDEITKYIEEGYFISRVYSLCIPEDETEIVDPDLVSG